MFISAKGYIGLAPSLVKDGDIIVVLYGGRVPYILRRVDTIPVDGITKPTYQLVEDSRVAGLMYGEAITMLDKGELREEEFTLV
jgi:hypothetical protein